MVCGKSQMPQGTSKTGSSHMRLRTAKTNRNKCILPHSPDTKLDLFPSNKSKPFKYVSVYPAIMSPELITIHELDMDELIATTWVSLQEQIGKFLFWTWYLLEKLMLYQFGNLTAVSWLQYRNCHIWSFSYAGARVIRAMWKYQT